MAEYLQQITGGLAARHASAQSTVRQAYEAVLQRQGARGLIAGAQHSGTAYTYRRSWVDFAGFLRYRLGAERSPVSWATTDADFRHAETDALLEYLDANISRIRVDDVNAYRVAMLSKPARTRAGRPRVGLSHRTINTRLAALRHLFKIAIRMGKRQDNPASPDAVDRHRPGECDRHRGLTVREAQRLLAGIAQDGAVGRRNWMLVHLMLHIGIRREEASRLRVEDLRQSHVGMTATLARKGDMQQTLLLPEAVERELRQYIADLELGQRGPIFPVLKPGAGAGPISPTTATKIVRALTSEIIGRSVGPHTLRRTFATRALESGAPLHEVQLYMGHSDPATTMAYYDAKLSRERSAAEFVAY